MTNMLQPEVVALRLQRGAEQDMGGRELHLDRFALCHFQRLEPVRLGQGAVSTHRVHITNGQYVAREA